MAFEYLSNEPLDKALEGFLKALEERGFAPRTEMEHYAISADRPCPAQCPSRHHERRPHLHPHLATADFILLHGRCRLLDGLSRT